MRGLFFLMLLSAWLSAEDILLPSGLRLEKTEVIDRRPGELLIKYAGGQRWVNLAHLPERLHDWKPTPGTPEAKVLNATEREARQPKRVRREVLLKKDVLYNLSKSFDGPWRDFQFEDLGVSTISYRVGYGYSERLVRSKINSGIDYEKCLTLLVEHGSTKFYYLDTAKRPNDHGVFVVERIE